jgi:hypothetical protein
MKTELALAAIPRRMNELGYGDNYILHHRHLRIPASKEIKINAANEVYFLVEEDTITFSSAKYDGADAIIRVTSDSGVYDLSEKKADEMQHEHTGGIVVKNLTKIDLFVKFIQVIPKHD